jgi:hypothetical protein
MPLDNRIEAMRQTGMGMSHKYKETSLGGLAVNLPKCRRRGRSTPICSSRRAIFFGSAMSASSMRAGRFELQMLLNTANALFDF